VAGPSVVVRVLADLKGFGSAFSSAGSTAEAGLKKIHGAFSGLLGTLNQTGVLGPFGDALNAVDQGLGALAEHGKTVGGVMLGVGGAMAGLGAGLQALGSKEQAAHQQLQQAVENTGKSYDDYAGQIEKSIKRMENFGFTAENTDDALRILTQATHDPGKALDLLGTAADVAKGKHEDLGTAAGQIGKVFNGNTKLLKEYGVIIDKNTKLTADGKTATQALADVTRGQAAAATDTFMGRLDGMKAKLEDATARFGQKYGPAITAAGTAMAGLGAAMSILPPLITAIGAAIDFMLGPIGLVILAIAAIGIAIYLIYRNWNTIWAAMKTAVEAVWNFIQTYWPLLLPILLGPFGILIDLVVKNFDTIKRVITDAVNVIVAVFSGIITAVSAVVNFVVPIFQFMGKVLEAIGLVIALPYIVAFEAISFVVGLVVQGITAAFHFLAGVLAAVANALVGPFQIAFSIISSVAGFVVAVIKAEWSGLVAFFQWVVGILAAILGPPFRVASDAAGSVVGAIEWWWNGLIGFFRTAVGTLGGIFSGMWDGITHAFKDAINGLIWIWNRLHFPAINVGPFHTPEIGVPQIRPFAAGGVVSSPTLALIGEAGPEAVVPLGRRGGLGPAVHIENVNVSDGADIDLLVARLSFATMAGRL